MPRKPAEAGGASNRRARQQARHAEPLPVESHLVAEEELPPEEVLPADQPESADADPELADADSDRDGAGSLVAYDPLSHYLAEIRRYPLLSREEETEVAKRYHTSHDREDALRLVTANLRLVVKIAHEFARASRNLIDLIQEGNIGLMEAVKSFDPYRGIRFPSYAVWWIRAYIIRYLMNNWRLVKIGTTQAQRKLFFNLKKESDRLEAEAFSAAAETFGPTHRGQGSGSPRNARAHGSERGFAGPAYRCR